MAIAAATQNPSRAPSRAASLKDRGQRSHHDLATAAAAAASVGRPMPLQLPQLHLIQTEITAVTSAMRKNPRFAAAATSGAASQYPSFAGFSSAPHPPGSTLPLTTAAIALTKPAVLAAGSSLGAAYVQPALTTKDSGTSAPSLSVGLRLAGSGGLKSKDDGPSRSASSSRTDDSAVGLFAGFTILRAQLREHPDLSTFPLPHLLAPFLRVILSPRTTAPITSAALQAVHRLLLYGLVRPPSATEVSAASDASHSDASGIGAQLAIAEIAHATSHCRFEASDAAVDELVLLRILAVMRELICEERGPPAPAPTGKETLLGYAPRPQALADCLGEESICEMMETGLSMCCQMRLSELLRRTAEQSLTSMIRTVFSRLDSIPTTADEAYNADPNAAPLQPELETLLAEPVGVDAEAAAADEKRLRRMTMPDPKSRAFPAAAGSLDELKEIGDKEELETDVQENTSPEGSVPTKEKAVTPASSEHKSPSAQGEQQNGAEVAQMAFAPIDVQPYGLPAIKEVLRVLVSLLDPHNGQHTDTMRMLGLTMLTSVFEVAGASIGRFPSLRGIVQDSACRHLFQLAKSQHPTLLTYSLRAIATMFETMREHLKLQQEFFLQFVIDRLAPTFPVAIDPWNELSLSAVAGRRGSVVSISRAGTPDNSLPPPPPPPPPMPKESDRAPAQGEAREQMLDMFGLLFRSFDRLPSEDQMVNLWVNCDCDMESENMFEIMMRFLCRSIYAANPQYPGAQEGSQLLALDTVLTFVESMAARQEADADVRWPADYPSVDDLVHQKSRKAAILDGAARFNAKPKDGLAYLEKEGFIVSASAGGNERDKSIAIFLKTCPRLDKKLLGDYLSRPDNIGVLQAFLELFDFRDQPVGDAMREMLESFRLPGESQQINRIAETFSKTYFNAAQPKDIANEDAVYVLTYSVIMLNTDLHNPQNKRRMTVDDYRRNLRGVNDGKDFDAEYLASIYDSIRRREIVMPEEHLGTLGFEYVWKELLRRSRSAGPLLQAHNTGVFDQAMLKAAWRPIVAAIAYAFSTFQDEHLLERAISGFRQCAILASKFSMIEMFDFMLRVLAGATGLLDSSLPRDVQLAMHATASGLANNAVIEVEGQKVTVSALSVRFGMNFKGQLAAVVLFTIVNGNGDAVRVGWAEIFEIFRNLFANSLLPISLCEMHDFTVENGMSRIPLRPKKPAGPTPQDPRAQGGGLFSTLSSYLLSPYSAAQEQQTPEPTEEDVESSLCTVDCVGSCRVEELYRQILRLKGDALICAVRALRELADRKTVDRVTGRATDVLDGPSGTSTPTQTPSPSATTRQVSYDASIIFVLELLTNITCEAGEAIPDVWPIVFEHVSALLSNAKSLHVLLVERAVVCVLRLVLVAADHDALRDQIFVSLDLLRSIPAQFRPAIAHQLLAGIDKILSVRPDFARSQTEWGLVVALLSDASIARNAPSARLGLQIARRLVGHPGESAIAVDNFLPLVSLLRTFASGGDTTILKEQREAQRRTLTEKKDLEEFERACEARAPDAVVLLEGMKVHVPAIIAAIGVPYFEAWKRFWPPLMGAVAEQCVNAHRATRQISVTHLQRLLLSQEVLAGSGSSGHEVPSLVKSIFSDILFPMLNELLKPQVFQRDASKEPGGMQETRMRACALLSKVWLHYLPLMSQATDDFGSLWAAILDFFDRFFSSGKQDHLTEAIPENLKNALLVMNASKLLLPPPMAGEADARTKAQVLLWDATFERTQRFLPRLKEELFPSTPAPTQPAASVAPASEQEEETSKPTAVSADDAIGSEVNSQSASETAE